MIKHKQIYFDKMENICPIEETYLAETFFGQPYIMLDRIDEEIHWKVRNLLVFITIDIKSDIYDKAQTNF